MKRSSSLAIVMIFLFSLGAILAPPASAAKTGSVCKKLNAKDWDKNQPIICKKSNSGKLVWTKFTNSSAVKKPTTAPSFQSLKISLTVVNKTYGTSNPYSVEICNKSRGDGDMWSSTGVEVRDGSGSLLATGSLGIATVVDHMFGVTGDCLFTPTIVVKKSEFYQVVIGSWFNKSFSHADLSAQNWNLSLSFPR
jgi:hypothetical protein